MKLFAIYLVFFRGYSVIRYADQWRSDNDHKEYGSCNVPLDFDYGHNGGWGEGNTPFKAVIDCYKKASHK